VPSHQSGSLEHAVKAKARCLSCGRVDYLTRSRCHTCHRTKRNARYPPAWQNYSAKRIAHHVATSGHTCPGWNRKPHEAHDLTLDHETDKVYCRACNTAKRDRGAP
jgi:hypothetical protein